MHILLIEDNVAIANSIQEYLELDGRSVDIFADGITGLKQASQFTYDCIILDVMLPGMDGFSLLAELRKQKQTPVIMTTAKGQINDKQE
jgi:two-component system copper resistance phosphate regulon response regulator CusR